MPDRRDPRVVNVSVTPATWLGKLVYAIIGVTLFVLAFFFLTVALVAGVIVALVLLARFWWLSRKLRRARQASALEGEFTVVERRESSRRIDQRE